MDSFTQATLGAGIGEIVLGRKVGNKAVFWGAVGGTLPDLDYFVSPYFDHIEMLFVHRGLSHSFFFALIVGSVVGWMLSHLHKKSGVTAKEWSLLFGLALATHALLDSFTVYGTGLLEPFSSYRVAWSTISIVDPIYTLPFFFPLLILIFFNRKSQIRFKLAVFGLTWSHVYLLLTILNSFYVQSHFKISLKEQGISYERFMTTPTLLNNLLWYGVAEGEKDYYAGYYSILDGSHPISFLQLPKNHQLENEIKRRDKNNKTPIDKIAILKKFAKNYYILESEGEGIYLKDLRFSVFKRDDGRYGTPFAYNLNDLDEEPWRRPDSDEAKEMLQRLYQRILGNRQGWW